MSTTVKIGYLRMLRKLGFSSIKATSVFGLPYRISLGDYFSENPYFNRVSNVGEILACAAWTTGKHRPVIYDIGAHCGFISTQLAGLLQTEQAVIYAFEPVPPTYHDLVSSVQELHLEKSIHPMPWALGDAEGVVHIRYSKWESMLSQVQVGPAPEGGGQVDVFEVKTTTLDNLMSELPLPLVIKIDVEGWEVPVLKGVRTTREKGLMSETAWCLEWNPEALKQTGQEKEEYFHQLPGHRFYYINDYEGQRIPMLERVDDPRRIDHVCNLFAIPPSSARDSEWLNNFRGLMSKYKVSVN